MCRMRIVLGWLVTILLAGQTYAAGPNGVSYQGYLQNPDTTPLNGAVDLQLAIWNSPSSIDVNDRLYIEAHGAVPVVNGLFSVELGGGTVIDGTFDPALFASNDRWLETVVDGDSLSPRTKFLSVPYALQAREADMFSGLSGAVMHFALPQCPTGWSELSQARGRALVGLPENGTLQGESGTPLTDLESRTHSHNVTVPSLVTTDSGFHNHSLGARTTTSDTHNHSWIRWNGPVTNWESYRSSGSRFTISDTGNGLDLAGSGVYPLAATSSSVTDIHTDNDAHNHSISAGFTATAAIHNHSTLNRNIGSAGTDAGMPYLQLLVCVKD